jgi:hypothetical protein
MSTLDGSGSLGCGSFVGLDGGARPGRPDPDGLPGDRILRGFAVAYAVDLAGNPISHDHLSGHVDIVNYRDRSAWEYNTYAFQCLAVAEPAGVDVECTVGAASPTNLLMNGLEYEQAWDQVLFDFYAVGSQAFSLNLANTVTLDTDLTLYPVSLDTRPNAANTNGPVLTKAEIVIWDEEENDHTNTARCINCWDQTLLSNYASAAFPTNHFFTIGALGFDKGKARIDGVRADSCDAPGACCCTRQCSVRPGACVDSSDCPLVNGFPQTCGLFNCFDPDCDLVDFARGTPDRDCSEDAALLGVSDKILAFSGAVISRTDAGMTLVGIGVQNAAILRDVIRPTAPLRTDGEAVAPVEVGSEDAVISSPRQMSRGQRTGKE